MKKVNLRILLILPIFSVVSFAQEKFDIVSFKTPAGWQKDVKPNAVQFATENASKGTFCLMMLFKSVSVDGDSKKNFQTSWQAIVKDTLAKVSEPELQPTATENSWNVESGIAQYENESTKGFAMLVSASGGGKVVNLLILSNTDAYQTEVLTFIESLVLPKISSVSSENSVQATNSVSLPMKSAFKFNTTNFDDGWTAVEESDWVRVTKGNITVLLHYPKEGTVFPADPDPLTRRAWDILVAPRYSRLKNFKTVSPSLDSQRAYLGYGYATDNKSQREVFVNLFRKGNSGWIEIICPDKNSFIQEFKFDPEQVKWDSDSEIWNGLKNLPSYNRFAVDAADFSGTWTSDFSGVQQLYNVYTGNYAGMNINQSNQEFTFNGNSYNWKILSVNGMVGSTKFSQAQSSGTLSVLGPWQVRLSNIEGKPKKYNAYFSCIKDARLLNLLDADFPGSGIYTVFGKKR